MEEGTSNVVSLEAIDNDALAAMYEDQSTVQNSFLVTEINPVITHDSEDGSTQCVVSMDQTAGFFNPETSEFVQPDQAETPTFQAGGQQVAAFHTLEGQVVYVAYTIQQDPVLVTSSKTDAQNPMCLSVSLNDGCAESTVAAMTLESLAKGLLLQNEVEEETSSQAVISKRKPLGQIVGAEVGIEEKFEVRNALLTPYTVKKKSKEQEPEGQFDCDLCMASFKRSNQLYGHLPTHASDHKFPCHSCLPGKSVFNRATSLANHEKKFHMSVRQHICDKCGDSFDRVSQLQNHTRRIHLLEKPHSCQICAKGFFKQSDLKTHLNIHLGISTHTCPTCGKHFSHVSNLTRHVRTHTGVRPYVCSECGRRFTQPGPMMSHKASHHSSQTVSCLVCTRVFKSVGLMRRHLYVVHPKEAENNPNLQALQMKVKFQARRYYCKVCGETFKFATQLHCHEISHIKQGIYCSNCDAKMPSLDHLKNHSCDNSKELPQVGIAMEVETRTESAIGAMAQEVVTSAEEEIMGEIVIYVSQEGQSQPTQVVIKRLPSTIDESLLLFDEPSESSVPPALIPAEENEENLCEKEQATTESNIIVVKQEVVETNPMQKQDSDDYVTEDSLLHDVEEKELSNDDDSVDPTEFLLKNEPEVSIVEEYPLPTQLKKKNVTVYSCNECGKQFLKNSYYQQHLGLHFVDQKKFICSICDQAFAWKTTLTKHMARHSNAPVVMYSCDRCDRQYPNSFQVQEHIKRDHNKERSNVCSECKKSFYKKHDLKLHMRTHTKERPYMCGTCGKCFYHPSHIIRHERTHTNQRPYVCHCGRTFTQSNSLQAHKQSHHRGGAG